MFLGGGRDWRTVDLKEEHERQERRGTQFGKYTRGDMISAQKKDRERS